MKLRSLIAEHLWDLRYDPWGTGNGVLFPVCHVLVVEGGQYPAGFQAAPSIQSRTDLVANEVTGENEIEARLLELLDDGHVELADLEHAARVFDRYLNLVKMAGRDY